MPLGYTVFTVKPLERSHSETLSISRGAGPYIRPNSAAVSHTWKLGEVESCCRSIKFFYAISRSGLRCNCRSMLSIANVSATFPRSFCAFASPRVFPASVCSLFGSIGCVMRTRAGAAVLALCATRAGVKPRVTAQQHNRHTKKDLARKHFDIRHPRKIRLIGIHSIFTPVGLRRGRLPFGYVL